MKWDRIQLGEVIDVKHGYAFKSEFFSNSGNHILLSPGSCHESGGLKLKGEKEKYYTGEFPSEYLLAEQDMLVVMTDLINTAPILGGAFLIPENDRFLHNQRLGLVKITNEQRIDKGFLYYLLNSYDYRAQVRGSASGATVRHTAPTRIKECLVLVPRDVAYQRKIGLTLAAYDGLIENNRRRMALLEDSARLLYNEWFVRLRFPGYEHTSIVDGVPKGWERKMLGEVACINQSNLSRTFDGEIEYIDIASVTPNAINETTQYHFRDAPGRARRVVCHGDIIWSCVRPNRRSHAVIWLPNENLIASTGFVVISPTLLPTSFLYQAVTTDLFVGYLTNRAKGAAYPAVVSGDFEHATILIPSAILLETFNTFAEPLLAESNNLHLQNQKLCAARDLLLPRLMSGELAA